MAGLQEAEYPDWSPLRFRSARSLPGQSCFGLESELSHSSRWKFEQPGSHQSSHRVLFPDTGSLRPAAHGRQAQSSVGPVPERSEHLLGSGVWWIEYISTNIW